MPNPLMIHVAFLMAVPIYAGITYFFIMPFPKLFPYDPIVSNILIFIGILQIPIGFLVPKIAKSYPAVALILSDAVFESIAIYGLVGPLFSMATPAAWALIGLSFVLLAANTLRLRSQD
ncbi:hypothetical protein LLG95_10440 [bacterium]|nr:hypothetical protein [bacterium]